MVQVSLKKMGCLAGLLMLVLLVGAFLVLFTDIGCHGHAVNVRRLPNPLDIAELNRLAPPGRVALDPAQLSELKRIYTDIVQAYSNRQVEVLREWRRKLPERVERVMQNDFDDMEHPLDRIIHDEIDPCLTQSRDTRSIMEKFRSVEDFERTASAMLEILGIYGDVHLRRRNFGMWFDGLEAHVVHWLKFCQNCFNAAGRTDMEKTAERFLAEWIDQIESENGYTRTLLIRHVACVRVQGDGLMENCGLTWDEVSQNVVLQITHGLVRAGYTPKWLGEFKNIPRHAAPHLPKE